MAADCANSSEVGWIPRNAPGNREGIHLWGSLTYEAFDETCRDVRSHDETSKSRESSELDEWFKEMGEHNRWMKRMEMRFVIGREFLNKSS